MHGKEEDGYVIIKLNDGEELWPALERVVRQFDIRSAIIISGIGMLKNFTIGFFKNGQYEWETFSDAYELVAMHGSISTAGEVVIHIHAGLAGPDHRLVGGHLKSADVCVLNEILIKKFEVAEFSREELPGLGLKGLRID